MTSEILFYLDGFLARNPGSTCVCTTEKHLDPTAPDAELIRCTLRDQLGYLVATAIGPTELRAKELLDLKLSLR